MSQSAQLDGPGSTASAGARTFRRASFATLPAAMSFRGFVAEPRMPNEQSYHGANTEQNQPSIPPVHERLITHHQREGRELPTRRDRHHDARDVRAELAEAAGRLPHELIAKPAGRACQRHRP